MNDVESLKLNFKMLMLLDPGLRNRLMDELKNAFNGKIDKITINGDRNDNALNIHFCNGLVLKIMDMHLSSMIILTDFIMSKEIKNDEDDENILNLIHIINKNLFTLLKRKNKNKKSLDELVKELL